MDYTLAAVPAAAILCGLTPEYAAGESAAVTFGRAVAQQLAGSPLAFTITVDASSGVTMRITARYVTQRVTSVLRWRADRFALTIDGRPDPLRRSGLAAQAGLLAALTRTAEPLGELAEHLAAELLAETIAYGTIGALGTDEEDLRYRCADCGRLDVDAVVGEPPSLVDHQCPPCRGVVPEPVTTPAKPVPAARPVPRIWPPLARPSGEQGALFTAELAAAPCATWPRPARWLPHQVLHDVARGRYLRPGGDRRVYVRTGAGPCRQIDGEELRVHSMLDRLGLLTSEATGSASTSAAAAGVPPSGWR